MYIVLLTDCGKAFTWGLGSAGQLGHGGTKNLSTVSYNGYDHNIYIYIYSLLK